MGSQKHFKFNSTRVFKTSFCLFLYETFHARVNKIYLFILIFIQDAPPTNGDFQGGPVVNIK